MTFNEYQQRALETNKYGDDLKLIALEIASEAVELAGKVKKIYRDKGGVIDAVGHAQLNAELGDILWGVAVFAAALGGDLEGIAQMNTWKLEDRAKRGVIHGEGDER